MGEVEQQVEEGRQRGSGWRWQRRELWVGERRRGWREMVHRGAIWVNIKD